MALGSRFQSVQQGEGNAFVNPQFSDPAAHCKLVMLMVNGRNLSTTTGVYVQLWDSSILLPVPPDPPPNPPAIQSLWVEPGGTFSWADPDGGCPFTDDGGCVWAISSDPIGFVPVPGVEVEIRFVAIQKSALVGP